MKYKLLEKSTRLPSSWTWKLSNYRRLGIVEFPDDCEKEPTQIRDTKLFTIVQTYEPLYKGTTDRCEFARYLKIANERIQELRDEDKLQKEKEAKKKAKKKAK